jgi:transposase
VIVSGVTAGEIAKLSNGAYSRFTPALRANLLSCCATPNITIMALPPKCPELNPVENVWQFLRDNWLSNPSSNLTTISSTTAVWRGTNSSISSGESCPSDCANGRTGSDQWDSVLMES